MGHGRRARRRSLAALMGAAVIALALASFGGVAAAVVTLTVSQTTGLTNNTVVSWSVTGVTPNALGSMVECNGDPEAPTMSVLGNTVPVGCSLPNLQSTGPTGSPSGTFTVKTGKIGPPGNPNTLDSSGQPAGVSANDYPCPPTQEQVDRGVVCVLAYGVASHPEDQAFVEIHFVGEPTPGGTTTSSSTTSTSTTSTTTTTTTPGSTTSTSSTLPPTTRPPIELFRCSGQRALAKAKVIDGSAAGIVAAQKRVKLTARMVAGGEGTCTFDNSTVIPDSFGMSFSLTGTATCNPVAELSGMPPFGKIKISITALGESFRLQGFIQLRNHPNDQAPDVYSVRGILSKGALAGADIDGSLWLDGTIKDKTNTTGGFAGYDVNPVDLAIMFASCTDSYSYGNLELTDGSDGIPSPIFQPYFIVGDGPSPIGDVWGYPTVAEGLIFSYTY
jgi:hypothetical protein